MGEPPTENPLPLAERIKSQSAEYKENLSQVWTDPNYPFERFRNIEDKTLDLFFEIYPEEKSKYGELKEKLANASPEEILETQIVIRKKYGLPMVEPKSNDPNHAPLAYWKSLAKIAEEYGIKISHEPNNSGMNNWGSYDPISNRINARFNPETPYRSVRVLEHELVHVLQRLKYPRMTLCEQEFEAFVVNYKFSRESNGKIEFYLKR